MTLDHWIDAKGNGWLNHVTLTRLDRVYRDFFRDLKVVYYTGKGKSFISVLFPKDVIGAMNKLADSSVRESAGVAKSNMYLFPHTKGSCLHVSGRWHAVHRMCVAANVKNPSLVTATKMRHRVSTIFAAKDIPEKDRELVYSHLGHTKQMNIDSYQAPLVEQEFLRIAPQLAHIDRCMYLNIYYSQLVNTCLSYYLKCYSDNQ